LTEAPTYPGALEAFREEGAVLRGLRVGLDGFEAAARQHRPALAYAIPVFQNPTGAVLAPLAGRRLVEAADAAGVPLIDDEVLADLGFPGVVSPPPLAAYGDSVISVGSLSKVVWGGLRIGWVRAPVPVITRLARLRAVHDLGGNIPAQLAAASLMPHLGAMCRRQAAERLTRHDHLRAELARQLPGWDAPPVPGGQTLWVRLPRGDGASFAQTALRHGVAVLPGSGLDPSGKIDDHLRIHFMFGRAGLSEAVRRLASAWHAYTVPASRVSAPAAMAV
jgi:DNA-binding transcriptional MocR family regulator